jgi:predicted nucleic acid-binding protein
VNSPDFGAAGSANTVVSNSGPLIAFAALGKLDLLRQLFGRVCIPGAVFDEVVVRGRGLPGSGEVDAANWIETHRVRDGFSVNLLREELDAGESEAIVLAQELGASLVLIDDGVARRKTQRLGLRVVGTLGVLLMCKEAGLIAQVQPVLEQLRQTDFRMSLRVYREVLLKAGEMS